MEKWIKWGTRKGDNLAREYCTCYTDMKPIHLPCTYNNLSHSQYKSLNMNKICPMVHTKPNVITEWKRTIKYDFYRVNVHEIT